MEMIMFMVSPPHMENKVMIKPTEHNSHVLPDTTDYK